MYTIVEKENFNIYVFDKIHMNIKIIDNGASKKVYIDYKGYNPVFTMLIGGFESECEMDSIKFDVDKENGNNTMYFIVNSNDLENSLMKFTSSLWKIKSKINLTNKMWQFGTFLKKR